MPLYHEDIITKGPWVDVRAFGEIGSGGDDTSVIQAALDDNNQDIFIPEGTFLCNLSVDGAVNIRGSGPKSILKAFDSNPVITVTERISAAISGQGSAMGRRFENFTISGNGKTAKGISYSAATVEEEIVAVYFDNCTRGIDFGTSLIGNTVRYCNFVTCDYGIYGKTVITLNQFIENRFRSIALCGVYLDGSGSILAGNEFSHNWFEGINGFAAILKGDTGSALVRQSNKLYGGWIESVATSASVTLDDEGSSTSFNIWTTDTILIADNLPDDCKFDDSFIKVSRYEAWQDDKAPSLTGTTVFEIDDALFDQPGGSGLVGPATGSLSIKRPRSNGGGKNGFIVEGLPMINNTGGHTNLISMQGLAANPAATLTYQDAQFNGSGIRRIALDPDTDRVTISVTLANSKYYSYSFSIRSSTSSNETDIQLTITGTGQLVGVQTIIARGDRWTHYVGSVFASSSAPSSQSIRFDTASTATFDISRFQMVEFSTKEAAETFIHNQQFAIGSTNYYTLANDATPSVITDEARSKWLTGGTTTITDFDDGFIGQEIVVMSEHAITITDGTNIFLNGSANFVMASTDSLTLIQKVDGLWYEVSRSAN